MLGQKRVLFFVSRKEPGLKVEDCYAIIWKQIYRSIKCDKSTYMHESERDFQSKCLAWTSFFSKTKSFTFFPSAIHGWHNNQDITPLSKHDYCFTQPRPMFVSNFYCITRYLLAWPKLVYFDWCNYIDWLSQLVHVTLESYIVQWHLTLGFNFY